MRPNYTDGVRRLISHAQAASTRDNHRFVHTEYLLLGLLQERNSATQILKTLGIDRKTLIHACEARCRRGTHGKDTGLKLTTRTQQVLIFAEKEADAAGEKKVSTPHVLLGLLLEQEGVAGAILRDAGVTVEAVRTALASSPEASESASSEPVTHRPNHPNTRARKPLWKILLRV